MTADGTAVFGEAVAMVADALGVESTRSCAEASTRRPSPTSTSARGASTPAASRGSRRAGRVASAIAPVVELSFRWKKGSGLDPDWQIEERSRDRVQGRPTVIAKLRFLPPPDFRAQTMSDFMVLGHIADRHAGDQRSRQSRHRPGS